MSTKRRSFFGKAAMGCVALAGMLAGGLAQAESFTVNVVDGTGAPVSGFKYTVQEDTTFAVDPSDPVNYPPVREDMLSFGFHASNHPPALGQASGSSVNGNTDLASAVVSDVAPGRYYVSVLPYEGYAMSGAPVSVAVGTAPSVTVVVESYPIPTAQIAIFLFEDNYPLSGTPDLPEEENPPLGELGPDGQGHVDWTQFNIILEDPAGLYGQQGGPLLQDAFGNQLGTTYNPDGTVLVPGDGVLRPDENGYLIVKNLAPGKYGVIVNPPGTGAGNPAWVQTSTIEGSKVIDAWVKANEPPFFVEFGLPGPHVFVGFVRTDRLAGVLSGGTTTVTGTVTNMHLSRSPATSFFSGQAFPGCWVAINEGGLVPGRALFAAPCDGDSNFTIPNVPDGVYELKIWDINLDMVIATQPLNVTGGACNALADCTLGEVAVFNWFSRLNTAIFNDTNQNGFWDATEGPVGPEAGPVGIRWRNGSAYQAFGSDTEGLAPFDEIFPFFHWLVAEVGFANKKATGATFVADAGGFVDTTTDAFPGFGELAPQPQVCSPAQSTNPDDPDFGCTVGVDLINPNTGDNLSRTEVGPVLTQAFQGFLGQTSVMQWGKAEYLDYYKFDPTLPFTWTYIGENGGISGLVHYAITRAEDEPQFAAAETWEPGVPRVQVALYADGDIDCDTNPAAGLWPAGDCDIDWNQDGIRDPNMGVITSLDGVDDDMDGNVYDLADVDNYPLGNFPGNEDVDRNGNGLFDLGDALQVTWTDSWDDSLPTGCQGANNIDVDLDGTITLDEDARCFDGLRNFNQVRPGVFDGGYAFADYDLTNPSLDPAVADKLNLFYADRITFVDAGLLPDAWMLPGDYVVEAATPPGYKLVKEEDRNVDFGDEYDPNPELIDPVCVGDLREVPPYFSFLTTDGSGDQLALIDPANVGNPDAAAPFAGAVRPLCDRKAVPLSAAQNAAANFFLFTDTPIAANASGVILNDLANEFNPNSPAFGEKYAPPFVPVGFYDWAGNQVNRVYADEFGRYNAALPSTYTVNLPIPSGMSPNMLVACMNDAGPIANPDFPADPFAPEFIIDPNFNPQYSQFCYTFQYMPGNTTYLDTPVESIAAFANPPTFPVDCDRADATPMIQLVERITNGGGGPFVSYDQTEQILVRSMGTAVQVPNPDYDGTNAKFITRDHGFGDLAGAVALEAANGGRTPLTVVNWDAQNITADVPAGSLVPGAYQVVVTRNNGVESPLGVTLTVGVRISGVDYGVRENTDGAPYTAVFERYAVHNVGPGGFATIQEAIDAAGTGDLILVAPGVYDELVVMWKPVKLQGWGAGAVTLQARQVPTEKIDAWRAKVEGLVLAGSISLLPGQELAPTGFPALGAPLFPTEEGAGIFVAGNAAGAARFNIPYNKGARIDGLTIVGASQGGAIMVNGYAPDLSIGNVRMTSNAGFYGGGIRLGHPTLAHEDEVTGLLVYTDAVNDRIRIHHNHIVRNGALNTDAAGGGIALHTGADAYRVQENWVCGNFSKGSGAGIGHLGYSHNGLIENNNIVFNESFSQATAESGGGIYVGGQPGLEPVPAGAAAGVGLLVSPGSGSVFIDANRIRGNLAGAGDGGGIAIQNVNGEDIVADPSFYNGWRDVYVTNNMITNNVAGLAAGGMSIENSLSVFIYNNTVANNDSTATTALAASADPNITLPQPAGIVGRAHTGDMGLLLADPAVGNVFNSDLLVFSDPWMQVNIIHQNRSFFWLNYDDPLTPVIETGVFPANCYPAFCDPAAQPVADYTDDLGVLPAGTGSGLLNPYYSLLTDNTGYHITNVSGAPAFVNAYLNGPRDNLNIPEFTTLQTAGAFDEGGNFIQVTYGPLSLGDRDYHITAGSAAIDAGGVVRGGRLTRDFDDDLRSLTAPVDIGADELQ